MINKRIVEKLVDGKWKRIKFKNIKIGDQLRYTDYDENGEMTIFPFKREDGDIKATGLPYLNNGIWTIPVDYHFTDKYIFEIKE